MFFSCILAGCTIDSSIPVQEAPGFTITDNDPDTPEDTDSIFTPGERVSNYEIEIKPGTEEGAEPLTPMVIKPTTGTNIKEIVVKIFPKDAAIDPTEVVVITSFLQKVCLKHSQK